MNRVIEPQFFGREGALIGFFVDKSAIFAALPLLFLAAIEILAQSGSQTLFAIRSISHHVSPILTPQPERAAAKD